MEDGFYRFVLEPSKEAFLEARRKIVEHKDYDPNSFILDDLSDLLDNEEYVKVVESNDINLLLSPKANLYKRFAHNKLGDERGAQIAEAVTRSILECILLTGKGTKEEPFIVTRVQDEYDLLSFLKEEHIKQSVHKEDGRVYDRIETKSDRIIFFDITDSYAMLSKVNPEEFLDRIFGEKEDQETGSAQEDESVEKRITPSKPKKKPWWKF